ncbi:hypothetical protein ACVIGB_005227 [Bradyrhizobium sp. USDA 4341]
MSLEPGGEVVAQGVTLCRALLTALEHGGSRAAIVDSVSGSLRLFDIGRRSVDGTFQKVFSVTVPRTDDPGIDVARAIEAFEQALLRDTEMFWNGHIETDDAYARRRRDG